MRSYLATRTLSGPTDPTELHRLKSEAWRQQGIVVMAPDELGVEDQWLAQAARNWAIKQFGRRDGR